MHMLVAMQPLHVNIQNAIHASGAQLKLPWKSLIATISASRIVNHNQEMQMYLCLHECICYENTMALSQLLLME